MKIMIDTNVIISAALFPNGNTAKAFFKAMMPPYEPIVCDYIVDELHRKFQESSRKSRQSWKRFYFWRCPSLRS